MLLPRGILMHLRPYHLRPQGGKNDGSGLVRRPSGLPSIAAAPCAAVNRRCGPNADITRPAPLSLICELFAGIIRTKAELSCTA
jgi:hypothetical protein